ncbi:MAG: D-alanyl-D-alanine carboxypeptidase family protein [Clostridia bacterium]|nr:D-alanyl-D-alanine carboxypeptidase family protein [Clostridia bacterium]
MIWLWISLALVVGGAQLAWWAAEPALAPPYENPSRYPELVYYHGCQSGPSVSAKAAILVEATTGTILYARNEHEVREPASITKVMTAIVAIERGDLSDTVKVSAGAARVGGSSLHLSAGATYKLEELVRATMLRSGNDGATAIAEHIAGSVSSFVSLMNVRAYSMGLKNTHFANPHGLSAPGHYTTAYDIALMCMTGFRLKKFADIVGCPELWSSPLGGGSRLVYNTNRLLWSMAGADGVKTGTTSQAGHCLAASATRNGLQFIAVVLRSGARFADAAALLEYGFARFTRHVIAKRGEPVAEVLVSGGRGSAVGLAPTRDVEVVLAIADSAKLTWRAEVPERAPRSVQAGQGLGRIRVLYDGEEICSYPLYAVEGVAKRRGRAPWVGGR